MCSYKKSAHQSVFVSAAGLLAVCHRFYSKRYTAVFFSSRCTCSVLTVKHGRRAPAENFAEGQALETIEVAKVPS